MNNIIGFIISVIYILFVLLISKLLENKGEEISRKFIHIALCNIWFIFAYFFDSLICAVILPTFFVFFNALSYKYKIVKSMERKENDGFGTVYYAISIVAIVIITYSVGNPWIGLSGMLIMGYGDGLAAIIGQKIKSKEFKVGNTKKSIAGSLTMFIISMFILLIILNMLNVQYFIIKAIVIALIATILEFISIKGLDNITVPVIVTLLTVLAI